MLPRLLLVRRRRVAASNVSIGLLSRLLVDKLLLSSVEGTLSGADGTSQSFRPIGVDRIGEALTGFGATGFGATGEASTGVESIVLLFGITIIILALFRGTVRARFRVGCPMAARWKLLPVETCLSPDIVSLELIIGTELCRMSE